MIGQGLVLMLSGMGIVYLFLGILITVTKFSMRGIGKLDAILPQDAPKKAPAARSAGGDEDANIALAIAVALNG